MLVPDCTVGVADPRFSTVMVGVGRPSTSLLALDAIPACTSTTAHLRNSGSVRRHLVWHRGRGRRSENAGLTAFLLRGLRKPSASSVIHLRKVEQDPARGGETRGWSACADHDGIRASRAGLNGPNPVQPWREQRSAASARHFTFMAMQDTGSQACHAIRLACCLRATASVSRNIATPENGEATCRGSLLPLWPPFSRFRRSGFPLARSKRCGGGDAQGHQSDAGKIEDLHVGQRIQGLQ